MYDEIKVDYIYPLNHIREYQINVGFKQQATDAEIFDKIYYNNLHRPG